MVKWTYFLVVFPYLPHKKSPWLVPWEFSRTKSHWWLLSSLIDHYSDFHCGWIYPWHSIMKSYRSSDFPWFSYRISPWNPLPIGSMYGIYANIWGILMVNVTMYSIHGSYGLWLGAMLLGGRFCVASAARASRRAAGREAGGGGVGGLCGAEPTQGAGRAMGQGHGAGPWGFFFFGELKR